MIEEYGSYDGIGLAELIARGEINSREVVASMLERIGQLNPRVNAVVELYDAELEKPVAGQGPLAGLPMLMKDLIVCVQGQVTANGSRLMRDMRAPADSTLVRRYRAAGMLIAGRTNSPEFGLSASTEPVLNGPTQNPWRPGYSPGGSSGGAAAAVAAGMVPFAHASDGGGSIRIPASACGLFGLKPTRGRVSPAPFLGEGWNGLSVHHVISRSVRDSAALLDVSHGYVPGDPYAAPAVDRPFLEETRRDPGRLRIGFCDHNPLGLPVAPECVDAVRHAARLCESLGHEVEEGLPDYDPAALSGASHLIVGAHVRATVLDTERRRGRAADDDELEPMARLMIGRADTQSAADYVEAQRTMHRLARDIARFWSRYDLWLTPTLGQTPQPLGTIVYREEMSFEDFGLKMATYVPFLGLANATGQPSMSVPLYWSADQLPVGVTFTGAFGDEARMYALAAQLERAQPWFERVPAL